MKAPRCEGLAQMKTGLTDHNPITVVIPRLKSLGQHITAERTIHAKDVSLRHTLRFMASQDADGENIRGINKFLWYICTKIAEHLPIRVLLFPFFGLLVPVVIDVLEF